MKKILLQLMRYKIDVIKRMLNKFFSTNREVKPILYQALDTFVSTDRIGAFHVRFQRMNDYYEGVGKYATREAETWKMLFDAAGPHGAGWYIFEGDHTGRLWAYSTAEIDGIWPPVNPEDWTSGPRIGWRFIYINVVLPSSDARAKVLPPLPRRSLS